MGRRLSPRRLGDRPGWPYLSHVDHYDVAVVGAGFGGLSAALAAAETGARVVLLEQLRYPGGCASTFSRRGARFEAGATLFSGFGKGQLFERWIRRYELPVRFDAIDPLIELRTPSWSVPIGQDREEFLTRWERLAEDRAPQVRAFFREQKAVADVLWELFDQPDLLPPLSFRGVLTHLRRLPRYLPLLRYVGRPLESVLRRHRLHTWQPLRTYLDAVCQITVQTNVREVEAPFALAAIDYCFRGTGHVHGGIGELAWALAAAAEHAGVDVRFSDRVDQIERVGAQKRLRTRRGQLLADRLVLNLTPHATRRLLADSVGKYRRLDRRAESVEGGWGAAMLYAVLRPGAPLPARAHHVELVSNENEAFVEGNHLFASVSGADEDRSPSGGRTMTISTHLPMGRVRSSRDTGRYIASVHQRMRATLAHLAPELASAIETDMTASPRTFERFTGRDFGYVGGIPRRVGLGQYLDAWPRAVAPGIWLVGDSVFPGQSTLASAIGGVRTVRAMLGRSAGVPRSGRSVRSVPRVESDAPVRLVR